MANFQTTVALKANTTQLTKALKKTTKQLEGINREVKRVQGKFTEFGKSATKSIAKINGAFAKHRQKLAGLFAALAGSIALGTNSLKKWEDGLTQIETLGVKSMKQVEKYLIKVRKQYGVTGEEATKGYYDIISAGAKAGTEAQEQLNAAVKLAKAGNTDLRKAVDILTSGMNVWKKDGVTALEVTDKLFLAVKYGKTTVEELAGTFGRVAPISEAAGAKLSDYAAAMAVLTANGLKTEDATTGLKGAFGGMLKVTEGAKKAVKGLNIQWEDAGTTWGASAIRAEGFEGVMIKLNDALNKQGKALGLSGGALEAYRSTQITKLFEDKTAAASIITLTNNMQKFSKIHKEMGDSAGTTNEAYLKTQKDLTYHLNKFKQVLSILSETIGHTFKPALVALMKHLTPVIELFTALAKESPGILRIAAAIATLATSIAFFGLLKTGVFGALIIGFKVLSTAFQNLGKDGAESLHYLQLVWNDTWRGFRNNPVVKAVIESFQGLSNAFDALPSFDLADMITGDYDWDIAKVELENSWIYFKSWFLVLKGDVSGWASDVADSAKKSFANFTDILPDIDLSEIFTGDFDVDIALVELENFWIYVKSGFLSMWDTISNYEWFKTLTKGLDAAEKYISETFNKIATYTLNIFDIDFDIAKVELENTWIYIKSWFLELLDLVPSISLSDMFNGEFDWAEFKVELDKFWAYIKTGFKKVGKALLEIDWIKSAFNSIKTGLEWVKTKFKDFGNWLIFGSYWTEMLAEVNKKTGDWTIGDIFAKVIDGIINAFTEAKKSVSSRTNHYS